MDWPLGKKDWRGRERSWGLLGLPGAHCQPPTGCAIHIPMLRLGPGPRSQKKPGRDSLELAVGILNSVLPFRAV